VILYRTGSHKSSVKTLFAGVTYSGFSTTVYLRRRKNIDALLPIAAIFARLFRKISFPDINILKGKGSNCEKNLILTIRVKCGFIISRSHFYR
jgi:hypothetical protein